MKQWMRNAPHNARSVVYKGETVTLSRLSRWSGIGYNTLKSALEKGEDLEQYIRRRTAKRDGVPLVDESEGVLTDYERARKLLCSSYGFTPGSLKTMLKRGEGVYEYSGDILTFRVELSGCGGVITVHTKGKPDQVWGKVDERGAKHERY